MSDSTQKIIIDPSSGKVSYITIIILILIGLVVVMLAYNYWLIYSCIPNTNIKEYREGYDEPPPDASDLKLIGSGSDVILGISTNEPQDPIVRSTLNKVSKYEPGDMNDILKQYYNSYVAAQQIEAANANVVVPPPNIKKELPSERLMREGFDQVQLSQQNQTQNQTQNKLQQNQTQQNQLQQNQLQQNQLQQLNTTNNDIKSEKPEKGIVKLIIYHMPGCGHCVAIMHGGPNGEKSQFEKLRDYFKNDNSVRIYDYQLGRDKEADKFNGFPVVMLVTSEGSEEYNGRRDAESMAKAIMNKKK